MDSTRVTIAALLSLALSGSVSYAPSIPRQSNRDAGRKTRKLRVRRRSDSGGMPAVRREVGVVPDGRSEEPGGWRAEVSSAGRHADAPPGSAGSGQCFVARPFRFT